MEINATLAGQLIFVWMLVSTTLLYLFRYRQAKVSAGQLLANIILSFLPPIGFIYTAYLFHKS